MPKLISKILTLITILHLTTLCPSKNCVSCNKYNNKNFCQKCYYSIFVQDSHSCESPDFPIDNCLEYISENNQSCLICEFGYNLKNNLCEKCPGNCASCISDSECTSCFHNLIPFKKKCEDFRNISKIPHCDIFHPGLKLCQKCEQNYSLDENLNCQNSIKNCIYVKKKKIIKGEEKYFCSICKEGFYMNEKFDCVKNVEDVHYIVYVIVICCVFFVLGLIGFFIYFFKKNRKGYLRQTTDNDYLVTIE